MMKKILFIFALLLTLNINAQNSNINKEEIMKTIMKIPEINAEYEVFDEKTWFSKKPRGEVKTRVVGKDTLRGFATTRSYEENDEKGQRRKYFSKGSSRISESDYTTNPIIGIHKKFYLNGGLELKGLSCCFGFAMGLWYYYDEQGNLIRTKNYDEGFEFTAEDIFAYCLDNNISLEKKEEALRTRIRKYTDAKNKSSWFIHYNDYTKRKEIVIRLDGKTGEVIEVTEYDFAIEH